MTSSSWEQPFLPKPLQLERGLHPEFRVPTGWPRVSLPLRARLVRRGGAGSQGLVSRAGLAAALKRSCGGSGATVPGPQRLTQDAGQLGNSRLAEAEAGSSPTGESERRPTVRLPRGHREPVQGAMGVAV